MTSIPRSQNQVISVSRRTDIPAFYLDWLYHVLKRGWVRVRNPFNPNQSRTVDLRPHAVHSLVLWSKDFSKLLNDPGPLESHRLAFHFTLNAPSPLEPRVPPLQARLQQMHDLARQFGPQTITWRFDPIVFWRSTQSTPSTHDAHHPFPLDEAPDVQHNAAAFERLAPIIRDAGITRCSVALVDAYAKTLRRTHSHGISIVTPNSATLHALSHFLVAVADRHHLDLSACCSPELLDHPAIQRGRCIDGTRLNHLAGTPSPSPQAASQRSRPTRKGCGCTESIDIGDYRRQPCLHGCLYCYANPATPHGPAQRP